MKRKLYLLLLATIALTTPTCKQDLDVPPLNIIKDADVFGNPSGIEAYMARIYSQIPMEDFKYDNTSGFKTFFNGSPYVITGEAISRDQANGTETFNYWADAYTLIRECNYFMETLPGFASGYSATQVNNWLGEARFIRAFAYYALAKRYGGVPLVNKVLTQPGQSIEEVTANIEELKIPRSSEQATWEFIAADLDYAYTNLPETNKKGRAHRYAAAALKSRVMLFAACIAKYNTINLTTNGVQVCGIPAAKATDYFKAAYDAANLLNGKSFVLYKAAWSATDKAAQANNFAALFLDGGSAENVFIRMYKYPDAVHWYDYNQVPRQLWNGGGAAQTSPTLDLVEMYDGLPKNADGTFRTTDAGGKYVLWDNTLQPFQNAEGRLRGTVVAPGDLLKGVAIELRRGIYTAPSAGGISRLLPVGSTAAYPSTNIVQSATNTQTPYKLPDGTLMNPAGASGFFTGINTVAGTISGFTIRKYIDPNKPTAEVNNNRSEQSWLEIRYAEVLLNRAEAAYELNSAGQGASYLTQAMADINAVRERAGAAPATAADMTSVDVVRKERRKELAFENKTAWDMKRWRISDKEQNGRRYRILNAFYVADNGKYFFDDRFDERGNVFTFDPRWYYQQIPTAVIGRSPNLVQNPGY
ncbi:RagB/SusD family nutrient uptake outer membrane protein [Hufsiella ginkgonis]|uniref:RagB/SusD family nutrient uptake outer membrane protein n=1 Tax=Hufsiella ginkgonis TaxID=2695274 RepID=A0A7K1XXH0_9SPHI|nr:RagB/SusD family nutrient uptake outer membrane protein [Hufsiella ginkgonis]MXV15429.1 RagB/SusD family nutrient uptake outer membrane protein [Hufsiella ginkgonis]